MKKLIIATAIASVFSVSAFAGTAAQNPSKSAPAPYDVKGKISSVTGMQKGAHDYADKSAYKAKQPQVFKSTKNTYQSQPKVKKSGSAVAESNPTVGKKDYKSSTLKADAAKSNYDKKVASTQAEEKLTSKENAYKAPETQAQWVSATSANAAAANDAISQNAASIEKNTQDIKSLRDDFEDQAKQLAGVGAMAMATSNLVTPYSVGKFTATAGVGNYDGESAIAVGTGYRVDEHLTFRANAAFETGTNNVGVGAGVGYEF